MSYADKVAALPDWTAESVSEKSASFVNEDRGLEVSIRAVFRGSRVRKQGREPSHYTVKLQQDWYAKGLHGDRQMAAKAQTRDEAFVIAQEFIEEFAAEHKQQDPEEIEAVHRSVEDRDSAEQILAGEVAAEAFTDAAGYSDELLLDVLDSETNGQYVGVIHRTHNALDIVDTGEGLDTSRLKTVFATFPVDDIGINHLLDAEFPVTVVVHLDKHTIYRFIFDDNRETDILLQRGTQVTSPGFERTITNVLEEK